MGYSTPKKPFDLKDFLAQKPTRRPLRWNKRPVPAPAADEPEAEPAVSPTPPTATD